LRVSILSEIKPSKREHKVLDAFIMKLKIGLVKALFEGGIDANVEVHGSVARDTWLVGQRDIDTFIVLRHGKGRRDLLRANEVVKGFVGEGWVEAYAEHPYVKKEMEGFDVEFIPCFKTEAGKRFTSSTDRTPLHTRFLLPRLTDAIRDEVRLLKAFTRGIGVYGAEIRVGGFSGYLCELLVLAFGSFEGVLEEAASWGEPNVIEFGGDLAKVTSEKFIEPLVVVDPVDRNRNVASAVSETTLWTFVAAARAFSAKPERRFFFPVVRNISKEDFLAMLESRGSDILFILIPDDDPPVPDSLWGQLYRVERALGRVLAERGFRVLRSATWSDEEKRHIFIYELEAITLPPMIKKVGPPVRLVKDSENFLETYRRSPDKVSGPGIDGGKWWVEVKRRHVFSSSFLRDALGIGCEESGVPKRLADLLRANGSVLINEEIECQLDGRFPSFLDGFLRGGPDWLE